MDLQTRRQANKARLSYLRQPDRYAGVLVLILASIILLTAVRVGPIGQLAASVLLSGSLLFTVYTSRARPRLVRITAVLAVAAPVLSIIAARLGSTRLAIDVETSVAAALVIVTPMVIARRLTQHPVVNAETIMGALCIYLLLGLFFAFVFRLTDAAGLHPFFAQKREATPTDYVYFSLVTLTTVGYGDLTPVHDLARMLAVTEALLGQMYLVTVVALLVGNIGRRRG